MYRACELTVNLRLSNEEAIAAYDMFLKALIKLTVNISGSGNAPLADPVVLDVPNVANSDSTKTVQSPDSEDDSDSEEE